MRCLVVVDMQYGFFAANAISTIRACRREVRKFVKAGDMIVYLEYLSSPSVWRPKPKWFGRTRDELTRITKGYERSFHKHKSDDNGSMEVMEVIQACAVEISEIRICGVNASYCVRETLGGLKERCGLHPLLLNTEMVVVADAVNCTSDVERNLVRWKNGGMKLVAVENTAYSHLKAAA